MFFVSFISGINLYYVLKQIRKVLKNDTLKSLVIVILTFIFIAVSIIYTIGVMSQFFVEDKEKDIKYETSIIKNRKITHKHINRDYMPLKALYLQNSYVKDRKDKTYVLDGNVEIIDEDKVNLKDEIKIKDAKENTLLEFPYYYYVGYQIKLESQDKIQNITPIESENGYLACIIPQDIDEGKITVEYVGTIITYISYSTSAISLILFICYIIYERKKGEKNDKK